MGKFSDPNYKLLKDYFDILVAVRTGTDKSYLIGPNKTVVSDGGLYTVLYEDNPDRGYVGHRFVIHEIDGNRFKMRYVGLESHFEITTLNTSTTTAELSAFGIGNNMYFRKDSFFHYWLARPEQDNLYHDYVNQEKTFIFFGKIWPANNQDGIYSIEFEGLKDFTLKGLPQHNQTINMSEWLKVYWDQIHHEMYNMTKNFWSMLDAREIDLRWLGYIASIYGIEISEQILNELSLREWVENLPYFLKRIGTYNALYIIWKLFLSNTQNHLNVYERWGEWCTRTLDETVGNIVDSFEDHHFLEFYGTQPSGGAGISYYSQYNPDNYPIHVQNPPESCGTFNWDFGSSENYLLFQNEHLNCSVGDIREDSIQITGVDPQRLTTQIIYLSGGDYSGDFTHSIGITMSSSTSGSSNIVFWALSNEVAPMSDMVGNHLSLRYETDGTDRYFVLSEYIAGSLYNYTTTTYAFQPDTTYYIIITRTDSALSATIFDRERMWVDDIVDSITINPLTSIFSFSDLYTLNTFRITGHQKWYGTIYGLYTTNVNYTRTISASGNKVITPHYKVQIDLSTEPLGDIFDDDTIISEDVIKELHKNFEYVRPVNKYAHYEELIAPLAKIDRIGDSIPLYPLTSNGYMNTFFTGSKYISAADATSLLGARTASYFQSYASKVWTVTHELNSEFLIVQPWAFVGLNSNNSFMMVPADIRIIDANTVELTFNESYRGIVLLASTIDVSGITYTGTDYVTAGNTTWSYNHNLYSYPASGYPSDVGPVVMHWNNDGYKIMPDINIMFSDDNFRSTWETVIEGYSLIRRSDYIHYQYDSDTKWTVNHRLNSWVIPQCYDITTDREIFPLSMVVLNDNSLEINWDSDKRGYVNLVAVPRDKVVYSPYSCDEFGIGMCADILGYWKVGIGNNASWNPFNEYDLESPIASGAYSNILSDDNSIYIDFIVPENIIDSNITEIGLFNYADQLVLYSRASGLFKPEGIQCFFHYRISKLNSSSSSSSSVSSSSSS